ncbi:hypothetical protein K470DRAFT_294903 [Piedraia hortae CBS 480.64]|uniref:RING-type domain-containing protein n=1 Tax=Piedraia hortae CBS 480.64 TaxID=1314780 RepID=A0A6A7BZ24_9PEZI|nr:hypothetical protein K470DRAFT_294903 [Piedraia hortae CBS 480.64]
MSRNQQDQFIDEDEEETCPLCVEEFDLSDKGFRPCPCGYQICQFCYHNVKENLNGLCPACRRPYNDSQIVYKAITAEETQAFKQRQLAKQKKTQQAAQKERQKAEADHSSRKHLAGLRVVQKNLVYVTGLSPTTHEDQLLQMLRGDQYFGQYGRIIKIVVSKAKDTAHPRSVGVYVTYERKEDAELCIAAVNGTRNNDRLLRAQFGTTKYCSAYLRGEQCQNRHCMFLHEAGEASESYSRADLSALNAGSSQHEGGRAPPPQSQQPVASAAQPMARQISSEQPQSPATDRPALPSTASWASKPINAPAAPESRSASGAHASPAIAPARPEVKKPEPKTKPAAPKREKPTIWIDELLKSFNLEDLRFELSTSGMSETDVKIIDSFPSFFDPNGAAKRRLRIQREEEERNEAQRQFPEPSGDNIEVSGSLRLGGEPEDGSGRDFGRSQTTESSALDQFAHSGAVSPSGLEGQRQQQQMALTGFQSQAPGHQRNTSRYSFANDAPATANVKPVANAAIVKQQAATMPQQRGFQQQPAQQPQQPQQPFYTSNVQGPPPGLKTAGTPPVASYGQTHGYGPYGASVRATDERMRTSGLVVEQKREFMTPSPYSVYQAAGPAGYAAPSPAFPVFSDGEKHGQRGKKKSKKHGRQGHAHTPSASSSMEAEMQTRFANYFPAGTAGLYNGGMMHGSGAYGGRW